MRYLITIAILLLGSVALAAEDREVIAIIGPAAYTGKAPDATDLGLIYRRKKLLWPDGMRIQPTNLPPDNEPTWIHQI